MLLDLTCEVCKEHLALIPVALVSRAQQPGNHCIFLEGFRQVMETRPCSCFDLLLQKVHLFLDVTQSLHRLLLGGVQVEYGLGLAPWLIEFWVSGDLVINSANLGVKIDGRTDEQHIVDEPYKVQTRQKELDLTPNGRGTHPLDKLWCIETAQVHKAVDRHLDCGKALYLVAQQKMHS